jgi:hypothetical protein
VAILFGAGASHGLIDAVTASDHGVALFAPFDATFRSAPFQLLPSCQVGLEEYLGFWGLVTITNEIVYVLLPVTIAISIVHTSGRERRRKVLIGAAALLGAGALRFVLPEYFAPSLPGVLRAHGSRKEGDPNDLPRDDLPAQKLVTRFEELRALGLFDRPLAPAVSVWSSSFFPAWFGSEGGRWQDGTPRLVWRTLFGVTPPSEDEARGWLAASAGGESAARERLFRLSPTEKLDLVLGNFDFRATRQALRHSSDKETLPRYWSGRCNGIATATLSHAEPFRVVDAVGVGGHVVRFHPNDVKALLAVAHYDVAVTRAVGHVCAEVSLHAGSRCSMNPAVLVIAIANRIGLAKQSFVVDALPTIAKQYYAVARAEVRVLSGPRALDGAPIEDALAARAASLVDVAIELALSSTTLAYAEADRLEPPGSDPTRYRKVGLVPVTARYRATLVLDAASELLGGRWTGDREQGPDDLVIVGGGPNLKNGDRLAAADEIPWPVVRELARASADEAASVPRLDVGELVRASR